MAEQTSQDLLAGATPAQAVIPPVRTQRPKVQLSKLHALPAPVRTFPLPTFYPHNPISWAHLSWAWLCQVLFRPPVEPSAIHRGVWDPASGSVHVTDEKSMRALWEQGFFGKGSLSRSEPNWLKREKFRRGQLSTTVSETHTVERREERKKVKWERARREQEAIRDTKRREKQEDEARLAVEAARKSVSSSDSAISMQSGHSARDTIPLPAPLLSVASAAPVGPLELLALPNSYKDLASLQSPCGHSAQTVVTGTSHHSRVVGPNGHLEARPFLFAAPVGPREILSLPNSTADLPLPSLHPSGFAHGYFTPPWHPASEGGPTDGAVHLPVREPQVSPGPSADDGEPVASATTSPPEQPSSRTFKTPSPGGTPLCQKSVRFSDNVMSATFRRTDPPDPNRSPRPAEAAPAASPAAPSPQPRPQDGDGDAVLVNKEHLRLTPEEAFFLAFGLGALTVVDREAHRPISTKDLFTLCRQHSTFPPQGPADLQSDDRFLVQYVVYHRFRSLGWVLRAGLKFGVDWMLYHRGPVFDHAEFGILVVPSFSDPWWQANGRSQSPPGTWSWLHGVMRVLNHVMKTLVLVYVEVPPPPMFEEALDRGVADALGLYKIKEVVVRRWAPNRNRKSTVRQ